MAALSRSPLREPAAQRLRPAWAARNGSADGVDARAPWSPSGGLLTRPGERFVDASLPVAYEPRVEGTGTDDYRCFVLDPALERDCLVAGVDIKPGNPALVHHVIVHKVAPDRVEEALALEAAEPDPGYSCFGGSGLESSPGEGLNRATWVGAWAPGGGERVLSEDVGIPLEQGSRLVVQMHYSTLGGSGAGPEQGPPASR